MDTHRVDIRYRPLRIAWAIRSGDLDALRKAVRYSFALWGGRFNPIIVIDHGSEASDIIDAFGVDFIVPIEDSDEATSFLKNYPHMIHPFHGQPLFIKGDEHHHAYSQVLDVHNALAFHTRKPAWDDVRKEKLKVFSWDPKDPLSDVFLMQLGGYPAKEEVGADYLEIFRSSADVVDTAIANGVEIPLEVTNFLGIPWVSRVGIEPINTNGSGGPRHPGYFVGDADSFDDLVCFWNLRAADIPMWFIDRRHTDRYKQLIPAWAQIMEKDLARYKHESDRLPGLWVRDSVENNKDGYASVRKPFGETRFAICRVLHRTWMSYNRAPPLMQLGEGTALGIKSADGKSPRISFALPNKPFDDDIWFYSQHLVASVSFLGGLFGDELNVLRPPYVPEFNSFYSRNMRFGLDSLRIEPDSIGLIIGVRDADNFVRALPVNEFMKRLFEFIGYKAEVSSAGLIARQLATQIGGIGGSTVFKIPGVRRLLSTHGPEAAFTKKAALCLIGSPDPDRSEVNFKNHEDLYIEPRSHDEKLTTDDVFGFLVEKGLYRMGAELLCPQCGMRSWTSMAVLDQHVICERCGHTHDASRQLADLNQWHYRRSGILGAERNAQGAVPVLMTLEYLSDELNSGLRDGFYSLSLDLNLITPVEGQRPFEVDFVWVAPHTPWERTAVLFGECKDHHAIDATDIESLRRLSTALPWRRFESFVVLSKIAPFTQEEINLAKTLNDEHHLRVIMLTGREMELAHLQSLRARNEKVPLVAGHSPQELANKTAEIYFK